MTGLTASERDGAVTGGPPGPARHTRSSGRRPRLVRDLMRGFLIVVGALILLSAATAAPETSASPVSPSGGPPPVVGTTDASGAAGSLPLGATRYPVPRGAVFVSVTGSDSNAGSMIAPLRTVTEATKVAPPGGTIVLRAGAYHESVMMPGHKTLTIQNFPGEAAWLDGSRRVAGWVRSGDAWVRSGWTTTFDASPTYHRGAQDGTEPGWQFIDPKFPMAAHPDQVFLDGTSLRQVASRREVGRGTFFVDDDHDQLVMGDDPTGRTVAASDLVVGLTATAPGSVVRGIGVFRFATSVPDMGTLRLFAANQTAENVMVADNATQGISLLGSGITLRKVTSSDNGLNGIHTSDTNNMTLDRVRVERNNRERFNWTPVAAGIKAHTSRSAVIKDSVISGNHANGIWFDVSNYDVRLLNNDVIGNAADGVILELSEDLQVVNNRVVDNGVQGLFLLDSGRASIWNNVITGATEPVRMHDTSRNAADLSSAPYGYDKRRPKPDPTVTWVVRDIEFKNNVVGGGNGGWCGVLCVLNDSDSRPADQMMRMDGNVYQRASTSTPPALIEWASGQGARTSYDVLTSFRAAHAGQDLHSAEVTGPRIAVPPEAGVPMPASIAAVLDLPAGTVHVGVRR